MLEYYLEIRTLHITAALLSGGLFFIRGVGLLLQQSWPKIPVLRYATYAVDSILLLAAFMLMGVLHIYPVSQPWLTVKVICVVIYIALGIMAFRTHCPRGRRFFLWLAALVVYGFIVSVARAHHPLGFLAKLLG
jgi:uncharacterized membrane protein SirB2